MMEGLIWDETNGFLGNKYHIYNLKLFACGLFQTTPEYNTEIEWPCRSTTYIIPSSQWACECEYLKWVNIPICKVAPSILHKDGWFSQGRTGSAAVTGSPRPWILACYMLCTVSWRLSYSKTRMCREVFNFLEYSVCEMPVWYLK